MPKDIQGVSVLPLLKGESPATWRKALYYHFYEFPAEHCVKRHYGIRTDKYTLIHFYNDIDAWEVYDLENDSQQMKNLYGQPAYKDIIKELKEQLVQLEVQYGATKSR